MVVFVDEDEVEQQRHTRQTCVNTADKSAKYGRRSELTPFFKIWFQSLIC